MTKSENQTTFSRAAFIGDFLHVFDEMPHRGTGTSFEPRAARIIAELSRERLTGHVETQPFAVDLSSGAWNVALHGTVLLVSLVVLWTGGLLVGKTWGVGRAPVDFGLLGLLPFPVVIACGVVSLAVLGSRFAAGISGWSLLSFLVPNGDSANIIASTLPRPKVEHLGLDPTEAWRRRFGECSAKRLIIFAAHYDSARCLRRGAEKGSTPKTLKAALKNGIGTLPTAALCVLILFLAAAAVLSWTGNAHLWLSRPWVVALVILFVLVSLAVEIVEAAMSLRSADLPFCAGYNDDLSGVAAIFELLAEVLPRKEQTDERGRIRCTNPALPLMRLDESELMAVFTGSEENGLRGAVEFTRSTLKPAIEHFGPDRVLLVNLDCVSGGSLRAASGEHTFVGLVRKGDPSFLEAARPHLQKPRNINGRDYCVGVAPDPLEACTDLTAFARARGLRAFSIVSRAEGGVEPRSYHSLSDGPQTLFDPQHQENLDTIVAVAEVLADLLAAADRGELDG